MKALETGVVAVIATMGRPAELAALLSSLADAHSRPLAAVIIDNGRSESTRRVVEACDFPAFYHAPGRNLGCGGGLQAGERLALERFGDQLTHFWILDDDAVVFPDTLTQLLAALDHDPEAAGACPLVEDRDGLLNWCPGLLEPEKFQVAKRPHLPTEYLRLCGDNPVRFSWAQGIALLATRAAVDRHGLHRDDFWMRGEDLDFSLRLTFHGRGLWVPRARVRHLPPASTSLPHVQYVRHAALLQNVAYIGLRLPHGRRIARTIPINWLRFCQAWGWNARVLWEATRALFCGAVLGWPAGRTYGRDA